MKTLLIASRASAPPLLGDLTHTMNWVSWETPGHGTNPMDRAQARVQYILDVEERARNQEVIPRPDIYYPPQYCPEGTLSAIIGVDREILLACTDDVPYPSITVQYALYIRAIGKDVYRHAQTTCTYLVPRLHDNEHCITSDGSGPFTIEDMLGGVLCTHVQGTEPRHMLRELLRGIGCPPHQFIR